MRTRCARFLRAIEDEVGSVLGDTGTVRVLEEPWELEGKGYLRVVLDYHSNRAINEIMGLIAPLVVQALWRAAHAGGDWRFFEWTPIEIEWPNIAIITLICGKALRPMYSSVPIATLFASSEMPEVQLHHWVPKIVDEDDFATSGLDVWRNPVLTTVLTAFSRIQDFVTTIGQIDDAFGTASDESFPESAIERLSKVVEVQFRLTRTFAVRSTNDALGVLRTSSFPESEAWHRQLIECSTTILMSLEEHKEIELSPDECVSWDERVSDAHVELQSLISCIADRVTRGSIGQPSKPFPSN